MCTTNRAQWQGVRWNQTLFKDLSEGPKNTCDTCLHGGHFGMLARTLGGEKADSVKLYAFATDTWTDFCIIIF